MKFFALAFRATGVLNIIAALAAIGSMTMHLDMFYGPVGVDPVFRFYHYNFWIIVLLFGIGYLYLASDPVRYRPIALLGGVAKLCIAASWIHLLTAGFGRPALYAGIAYDVLTGVILAYFFVSSWKSVAADGRAAG